MKLSLYIDEKKVEAIDLPIGKTNLMELMAELRKRYADLLKNSGSHSFYIENVPSSINNFQPLVQKDTLGFAI